MHFDLTHWSDRLSDTCDTWRCGHVASVGGRARDLRQAVLGSVSGGHSAVPAHTSESCSATRDPPRRPCAAGRARLECGQPVGRASDPRRASCRAPRSSSSRLRRASRPGTTARDDGRTLAARRTPAPRFLRRPSAHPGMPRAHLGTSGRISPARRGTPRPRARAARPSPTARSIPRRSCR